MFCIVPFLISSLAEPVIDIALALFSLPATGLILPPWITDLALVLTSPLEAVIKASLASTLLPSITTSPTVSLPPAATLNKAPVLAEPLVIFLLGAVKGTGVGIVPLYIGLFAVPPETLSPVGLSNSVLVRVTSILPGILTVESITASFCNAI